MSHGTKWGIALGGLTLGLLCLVPSHVWYTYLPMAEIRQELFAIRLALHGYVVYIAIGLIAGLAAFAIGYWASPRQEPAAEAMSDRRFLTQTWTMDAVDTAAFAVREEASVPVRISDATGQAEPYYGMLLDRSAAGMSLLVDGAVRKGTVLTVHAAMAPASIPWVQLKVKKCRRADKSHALDCQFVQAPAASQLCWFH